MSPSVETPVERMAGSPLSATRSRRGRWFNSGEAIFTATAPRRRSIAKLRGPNTEARNRAPRLSAACLSRAKNSSPRSSARKRS